MVPGFVLLLERSEETLRREFWFAECMDGGDAGKAEGKESGLGYRQQRTHK
jgi:hypothetical protein